ncbi:MAG: cobalamin B12-binding domain-containing protein [Phycisphaerales bacterium]|nr:cobalamin B12-binding domain-containing protein [Phycisphaerales bacterium]
MNHEALTERFFETLISGNRAAAREVVTGARQSGMSAEDLITELFWPTYELIERLFRGDQLTTLNHHLGSRLLRVFVDQNAALLQPAASRGKSIFVVCGKSDADDLAAQMASDLLECAGFEVAFAGGGVANDEVLGRVNEEHPDVLLMFASGPADLPDIRQLIDTLGEIGACRDMQIAVGAGVFNRAEGLAEEIGADLWASSPLEMVDRLVHEPARRAAASQRTVGRKRQSKAA